MHVSRDTSCQQAAEPVHPVLKLEYILFQDFSCFTSQQVKLHPVVISSFAYIKLSLLHPARIHYILSGELCLCAILIVTLMPSYIPSIGCISSSMTNTFKLKLHHVLDPHHCFGYLWAYETRIRKDTPAHDSCHAIGHRCAFVSHNCICDFTAQCDIKLSLKTLS